MIDKVKNILVDPKGEFAKVEKEEAPAMVASFTTYAMILFLIPAVFTIIGWGLIGYNFGFISIKSWELGIKLGITLFVACSAAFFAATYLIDALAPSFKSTKNLNRSAQLVALAITPAAVAGVFCLFPSLAVLMVLGAIYSGYIFYLGLPSLMKTPIDQAPIYAIVATLIVLVTAYLVSYILGQILAGSGMDASLRF